MSRLRTIAQIYRLTPPPPPYQIKTQVKFPDNTTQQWLSYDAFGQARQFKDERQNVTNLVYWQWGPMKKQAQVITYRAKDGGGTEEQLTAFWHDKMGRLTETIFPDGTYEQNTYDCGQLATWKTRRHQTKGLSYDARGREKSHAWDGGTAPGIDRVWDAANRLTSISNSFSIIDTPMTMRGRRSGKGAWQQMEVQICLALQAPIWLHFVFLPPPPLKHVSSPRPGLPFSARVTS